MGPWTKLRRRNDDLEEEIGAHLRMAARDRVEQGEAYEEARHSATREFGNRELVKEVTRTMWGWAAWERFGQDLRYAARMALKSPGFSAVVVLTLALGIGANTAIYSVVHAALMPLNISSPDRVVMVWTENPGRDWHQFPASVPDFEAWGNSGVFSAIGGFTQVGVNLRIANATERVDAANMTAGMFRVLDTPPLLGRTFREEETQTGRDGVVILTEKFWRSRFAADPDVIGKSVVVNGAPRTVIGVLSKKFPVLSTEQIYTPLVLPPAATSRGSRFFGVMGRLRPGITLSAAQQQMTALSARLAKQNPGDEAGNTTLLQLFAENLVQDSRQILIVLFAAVGFVLLIACANIASLLLARGTARTKEMALRTALGATRVALGRQLVCESVFLSLIGGLLALPVAWAGIRLIASYELEALPNVDSITLNPSVLAFNLAVSLLTGVLFGLVPAWQVRYKEAGEALKAGSRSVVGGLHQRLRSVFVVGEIALSLVLLAGAGLMVESFLKLRATNPGYDSKGTLTLRIALADSKYREQATWTRFYDQVLTQARSLPGVQSAGAISTLPTSDDFSGRGVYFPGRPDPRDEDVPVAVICSAASGYFESMRIPLLHGRFITSSDRKEGQPVALVDEQTARRFWPNEDAVGKVIRLGRKEAPRQIVGVVGNVETQSIVQKLAAGNPPLIYLSYEQAPNAGMSLVLRTSGDMAPLIAGVRAIVRNLDVDQPIFEVRTMEQSRASRRAAQQLVSVLLAAFAGLGLLLAAIGIYGVIAYNAAQRTREFGIRMSLGAQPRSVLRLVIRQGFVLAAAGLAIGFMGAIVVTRAMNGMLYGVGTMNPLTLVFVAILLLIVAIAASYVPARRATKVDPMQALRSE